MKYLDSKPFSVSLGESAAYRSNWDAVFGKGKKAAPKKQAPKKGKAR